MEQLLIDHLQVLSTPLTGTKHREKLTRMHLKTSLRNPPTGSFELLYEL